MTTEAQEDLVTDPLSLSDEDFEKLMVVDVSDTEEEEDTLDEEQDESTNEEEEDDNEESVEDDEEEDVESENDEDIDDSTDDDVEDTNEEEDSDNKDETEDTSDVDYKTEYNRLLQPFKANGREVKVDSVDEAITLMQMGANYNKKMAGLKPSLRIVKMLENNKLLDEDKLSYLIDLDKKNPQAIAKLIKESGIDPLDVDVDKATDYKPDTYTVNDAQVELDQVLEDIQGTPGYERTVDLVSNKWDESSKTVLLENPTIMRTINEHMSSGIYDQVAAVVDKQRMLGNLTGLSDLEAYKITGDNLLAAQARQTKTPSKNAKARIDPKLSKRKKAVSSTKSKPAPKTNPDFNPLAMSDEEFERYEAGKF